MGRYRWEELEDLYQEARRKEIGAWEELEIEGVGRLTHWVVKHADIRPLTVWEIEDFARVGFEEVGIRIKRIPTWPQAWVYAKKTTQRLFSTSRRVARLVFIRTGIPKNFDRIPDPHSLRFVAEIDFVDELGSIAGRLRSEGGRFLANFRLAVMDEPTKIGVARRLGISERSLRRKVLAIKELFGEIP